MRQLRLSLYLVVGLLLGATTSFAFAGYAQLKPPPFVGGSVGSRVTNGGVSANAGQFSGGLTTNVGGVPIVVPASWSMAANAGQFAISAIRATPAGLIGSAVAAWLLTQGIEYVNDQFMKPGESSPQPPDTKCWVKAYGTGTVCGNAAFYANVLEGYPTLAPFSAAQDLGTSIKVCRAPPEGWFCFTGALASTQPTPCPAGTTLNGTQCVGQAVPAGQADFDAIGQQLPDAVINELSGKGVPLPLNPPSVNPQPVTQPLSDPYVDPVTGKTIRDVVEVVPQPNDPERAVIRTTTQELDPATGEPATDPTSGEPVPPADNKDFCLENPDALACWKEGEPDETDLDKDTRNISITPQSGWGSDNGQCPADLTATLHNGLQVAFKWKPVCDGALMFRPVVIGMAWLASLFAFMGIARKVE